MSFSSDAVNANPVRIAHLSDFHFSEHCDKDCDDATHSTKHLIDLQRALQRLTFDHLVVSGDLSDRGNRDALLRANDYLFSQYSIGEGQSIGLSLAPEVVGLVPGNHDAFNTNHNGDTLTRWQQSLANFSQTSHG
jgi:3',5'-cyclic AMP phosphodiesterase CpdA